MSDDDWRRRYTQETPIDPSTAETLKPFLREMAMTIRILQNRLDDVTSRLDKLEADRASSPGWYIDEGA